jgi:hypothetical protein
LQADTAVRGAANVLTFGLADKLEAGADAIAAPGGLDHWRQRYDANFVQEQARNRYDSSHRHLAQAIGQGVGTALGLGLVGPAEGALAAAPRLPGGAAMTAREGAAALGAGGLAGLGMQAGADVATGRHSSLGDKAGAVAGGAAGVAALPLSPGRAGAVGAWATSAAQDVFNGRPISLDRAGESAIAGNILGAAAGKIGVKASNDLPMSAKGRLGEAMGDIRSTVDGHPRELGSKSRDYLNNGRYWYPDARSGSIMFEDKFGYGARLTRNQVQAQAEHGPNFRLYHFLPDDIGAATSVPAAAAAPQIFGRQGHR